MHECLACGVQVDLEFDSVDISADWVQVILKCPACGILYVGDIQIAHLELEEE